MGAKTLKLLFATGFFFLMLQTTLAQTITLTGQDFTDAAILQDTKMGMEYVANTNYRTYPRLTATAWATSVLRTYSRTLMNFNLQAIPAGSTIQSATLYFYSDPTKTSTSANDGNSKLSGSNSFYLVSS